MVVRGGHTSGLAGGGWVVKEVSHQLFSKFQDQVYHFHLRLILHPGLNVLLGIFPVLLTRFPTSPGPVPIPSLCLPSPPHK